MTTTNDKNKKSKEQDPLVKQTAASSDDFVIATSTGGTTPEPTVHALFQSSNPEDVETSIAFMRKVFALLVFQYTTVLIVASPFALLPTFQDFIHPHYHTLLIISIACMILSIILAITKGALYPYSRIVIATLTLSVAVELGLTFEEKSWGDYGLVAVGQATASFCILLASLQFATNNLLDWFTFSVATLVCLILAGIWSVVLHEVGLTWGIAIAVSLGGWVFLMLNLTQFRTLCKLVAPSEYVFATLFILFPQAVVCLSKSNKRHVVAVSDVDDNDEEKGRKDYGGVGATVM